jgi:broad specificity phosphatase PhoE
MKAARMPQAVFGAWRTSALAAVLVLAMLAAPACGGDPCEGHRPTTVLLVRHAEKAAVPEGDPVLSPAGEARAAELARLLGEAGIDAIYVTATTRTRQTAKDLAEDVGIEPIELAPRDVEGLVRRIRTDHRGQTVLAVGHSNTVPDVIEALGGPAMPDLDEADYDNLFVVSLPCAGETAVTRIRFRAPAAPASGQN